jgi:hypothetical protein
LFKKKSQLPVAASAYWSMATMIACWLQQDRHQRGGSQGSPFWRSYFTIGQQRWLDKHRRW